MPPNSQTNVSLLLKLGTTSVECQVIDASFKPPGVGASTITQTACPNGIVSEPGAVVSGALTGNVFADSLDSGITKILADAYSTNTTLAYEITFWADLGPTKGMKYTGSARVSTFTLDWSKPGVGRHGIDLEILSAALARPAAAQSEEAA